MPTARTIRSGSAWLLLAMMLLAAAGCGQSDAQVESPDLRDEAQVQLDALMTGDAEAAHSGSSIRCRQMGSKSDFRDDLAQVQRRLPEMKTWRFKILAVEEKDRTGVVRTIAMDSERQVVGAAGYSNNEDRWPFVLEDGHWRNDFCNS